MLKIAYTNATFSFGGMNGAARIKRRPKDAQDVQKMSCDAHKTRMKERAGRTRNLQALPVRSSHHVLQHGPRNILIYKITMQF